MTVYWFFFTLSSYLLITENENKKNTSILKYFLHFLLIIFIGFRFEIGGDWGNYLEIYSYIDLQDIISAHIKTDIGYNLLLLITKKLNLGIYGINTICGFIVILSVHLICSLNKKYYWICFLILLPYYILVVSTGYTRQSVSIAFSLIGIYYLLSRKKRYYQNYLYFSFFVFLGILFHKSAIISFIFLIPFLNYLIIIFSILFVIINITFLMTLFIDELRRVIEQYIIVQYTSQGAILRSLVLLPSLIFHYLLLKFNAYSINERRLFMTYSILVVLVMLLVFIKPLTIVDRFALYLIPLSAILYAKFAYILKDTTNVLLYKLLIVFFTFFLLFTWLNFSGHQSYWVPYKNVIFNIFFYA